jgi:nucleoside-diphosphate-sugar epimerase
VARALILAGTGAIGRATALRLLQRGWDVDVTGRSPHLFSEDVADLGGRFILSDRHDATQLKSVFADGVDLLVDCACFSARHAEQLVPYARDAASTVVMSSKGVYVDEAGNHVNSDESTHFAGPIRETQATVAPGGGDFNSREGYGANKVAAEMVLFNSGLPVTVIRASKIHGVDARRPREWYFVKRVLDARPAVLLARRGEGVDHPTAAVNVAALIEIVASQPGQRTLNCADPDAPSVREIAHVVAQHFGYEWEEVLLDANAPEGLARSPWGAPHPIVLDMSAALELGYVPAGDYATTVHDEIEWLSSIAVGPGAYRLPDDLDNDFFRRSFDYVAEDSFLASTLGRS